MRIASVDDFVRLCAAGADVASLEAADEIWLDVIRRHPELCEFVAMNKVLPSAVHETLATHSDSKVRLTLAFRRQLSESILELLSVDPDEAVRIRVCWNPKTPRRLLESMSKYPDTLVATTALERWKKRFG